MAGSIKSAPQQGRAFDVLNVWRSRSPAFGAQIATLCGFTLSRFICSLFSAVI